MIISFLLIFICTFIAWIHHHFLKPTKKYKTPVQYALLLGCPCHEDGSMSTSQLKRCQLAIKAYQKGYFKTLIISGGAVQNKYCESKEMSKYIHSQVNIPILEEHNAKNTFENFKFTKEITKDTNLLILTSSLHARRSQAIARQFYSNSYVYTYPDHKLKHIFREIISRVIYIQIEIKKKWGKY